MNIIGKRIQALRKGARDSQEVLAKMIGVSRSQLAMIEGGKRSASPEQLAQIADIYNVDMNYLYGLQANENSHRLVSEHEYSIIRAYRKASPEVQAIIDGIAKRK